ncbi:Protein YciE [Methylobacterium crusticola]|uniref:Protein YciE n=1 Tax=Methylobacterium crusticola TaxID=1697972 RepID=A0ABQ4R569_9HYPH|nr:ferritin-like domain-containing protein [Methylobacterium crusticola]GJD52090.1 Protein YciE [Methylobacterium crusticola]
MATTTTSGLTSASANETVQAIYITALRNTHALEKQAAQMIERQLERYRNYPDLTQALRLHKSETDQQVTRLADILHGHGEDRSLLKDVVTQTVGNVAALVHSVSGDEVLKNLYTDYSVETYEIAAYTSLITLAEEAGQRQDVETLRLSLREEERMAEAVFAQIVPVTRHYVAREVQGAKSDR